jgi:hypothetical protein
MDEGGEMKARRGHLDFGYGVKGRAHFSLPTRGLTR